MSDTLFINWKLIIHVLKRAHFFRWASIGYSFGRVGRNYTVWAKRVYNFLIFCFFFIKKKESKILVFNSLWFFFFLIKRNKNQDKTIAQHHAAPAPTCFVAPNPLKRVPKRCSMKKIVLLIFNLLP